MSKSELKCDRCGRESQYLEYCNYCKRKSCMACIKSSKRASKIRRAVICKDCWGNSDTRFKYKRER
ncbi:MAG: hypothetical protein WC607_03845 [Candidatus Micrarchaeia archaeon]